MTELLKLLETPPMNGNDFALISSFLRLFAAFILNLILAVTYRKLHNDKEDCHVIMHSIVYIGVIMAGAMMMISSNMVVAFGLIGAVSIVRFRTALSNAIDMSFIFLSIIVGISCGLSFYVLACILTFFIGILMIFFHKFKLGIGSPSSFTFIIKVSVNKKYFPKDGLTAIQNSIVDDLYMMEMKTSKSRVMVTFKLVLGSLNEVKLIHDYIQSSFPDDKNLNIKFTRV